MNTTDAKPSHAATAQDRACLLGPMDGEFVLRLAGDWSIAHGLGRGNTIVAPLRKHAGAGWVILDAAGLVRWDFILVAFMVDLERLTAACGIELDRAGLPRGVWRRWCIEIRPDTLMHQRQSQGLLAVGRDQSSPGGQPCGRRKIAPWSAILEPEGAVGRAISVGGVPHSTRQAGRAAAIGGYAPLARWPVLRGPDRLPVAPPTALSGLSEAADGEFLHAAVPAYGRLGSDPPPPPSHAARGGGAPAQPDFGVHRHSEREDHRKTGPRDCDAAKTVWGRKRHIAVDTSGLLRGVLIHAANVQDADSQHDLLKQAVGSGKQQPNSLLSTSTALHEVDGMRFNSLRPMIKPGIQVNVTRSSLLSSRQLPKLSALHRQLSMGGGIRLGDPITSLAQASGS